MLSSAVCRPYVAKLPWRAASDVRGGLNASSGLAGSEKQEDVATNTQRFTDTMTQPPPVRSD
jgi:hypothetical protein